LEVAVLLVAHQILIRFLAEKNVVSAIFSGGQHVPVVIMTTAIAFMVVRLLVILGLPGMILCRVGLIAFEYVRWKRKERGHA
jgi:hypothetical protein